MYRKFAPGREQLPPVPSDVERRTATAPVCRLSRCPRPPPELRTARLGGHETGVKGSKSWAGREISDGWVAGVQVPMQGGLAAGAYVITKTS